MEAIKRVYASTFSQHAKRYVRATPYRLEEEKMAVIVQQVVGAQHGPRFYPDFSGVVRSHNFYPVSPMSAGDGIAAVALGLGRSVIGGEKCLMFCPRYPRHLVQFSSVEDMLANSQTAFWALDLDHSAHAPTSIAELRETSFGLDVAEADGTLHMLGSTYSADNDAVYDGLGRPGARIVSFAPILKHDIFPLAEILDQLMSAGADALGRPVEIEFAVRLAREPGETAEFGFLQIRPLALSREAEEVRMEEVDPSRLVCQSAKVLGNGRLDYLHDIVMVDLHRFERARSPGGGPRSRAVQRQAKRQRHAVSPDRRRTLGIERSLAWHSGGVGPSVGCACYRGGRISRSACDALARQPLLPEPDGISGRLFHGQSRHRRRLRRLALACGTTRRGGA